MLGLKHGINTIEDHDPEWSRAFLEERARIDAAIGTVARGIEHYGSTAVDELKAKPILDILVGVAPLEEWISCKHPLETLGYDYADNAGVPGHHIFGRGRDRSERTHLVHVDLVFAASRIRRASRQTSSAKSGGETRPSFCRARGTETDHNRKRA